ncbi:MAG: hypothetical protein IT377_32550 [Polyangiaceae bacterium]|nr:hypothetical protein [Polyangiaceae bacterium]
MLALALSIIVAGACVWVSTKRLALVRRVAREAIHSDGLERAGQGRLLAKLPADGPLARTAREVLDAPSRAQAIATLNEALGDVARELDVSREVPKSATRVALASGALLGLVELGRRLPDGDGVAALAAAAPAVVVGGVGAVVCLISARSAEEHGRRARDGWDRLGRILERLLSESGNVGGGEAQQRVDPEAPAD